MSRLVVGFPFLLALSIVTGCQLQATTSGSGGTVPVPVATAGGGPATPADDDRASGASTAAIITIPDTVGRTKAEAEAALRAAGVRGEIKVGNDPGQVDLAVAKVCTQNPGGGQQTRASLHVTLNYCVPERAVVAAPVLTGFTVAEATQRARAAGFKGEIKVFEHQDFNPSCKADTVCGVDPHYWHKVPHDKMTLWINRKMKISTPD